MSSELICESAALMDETLIPIKEAGKHFPVLVSQPCIERSIRVGTRGMRLETILIARRRYTSKEAIRRFIERTQNVGDPINHPEPEPRYKKRSKAELEKARIRFNLPEPE